MIYYLSAYLSVKTDICGFNEILSHSSGIGNKIKSRKKTKRQSNRQKMNKWKKQVQLNLTILPMILGLIFSNSF